MRAAIFGTGYAAAQHADALVQLGDVEIVAVVGRDEERARAAAARLGIARGTADVQRLLADPSIDVVHVCTPNDSHVPLARGALRAGKHVLCEKPLALDVAGGEELVEIASATDRLALVCLNYRFFPTLQTLAAMARAGELGRLHLFRGSFLQDRLLQETATGWRSDPARAGTSGALADIGTHLVDAAEMVTGQRVVSVQAQTASLRGGRPIDDQASLLLTFDDGLQGAVVISQVAAGHVNDVELALHGSAASAVWRNDVPHELLIGHPDRSETVVGAAPVPNESRRRMIAAAYATIRGAGTAAGLPTFADGLHQLRVVAAALESARSGATVRVKA